MRPNVKKSRWNTKITFDPMLATSWRTLSSSPRPIEDTPMTTATPITIPSTVNPERSLLLLMVSVAMWTISPNSLFRNMRTYLSPALRFVASATEARGLKLATFQIVAPRSDQVWLPAAPDRPQKIHLHWPRPLAPPTPPRA